MKRLALTLILMATPAISEENSHYTEVGGWYIYRHSNDCSAISTFEDDEMVSFSYNAKDKTTQVMFSYKDGTSLKENDEKTLGVYIIRPNGKLDDGWDSVKFFAIVGSDGLPSLVSQPLKAPALEDFKKALTIGFFYDGNKIGSYKLQGTDAALSEVERCSQRIHNINPRDVFAK